MSTERPGPEDFGFEKIDLPNPEEALAKEPSAKLLEASHALYQLAARRAAAGSEEFTAEDEAAIAGLGLSNDELYQAVKLATAKAAGEVDNAQAGSMDPFIDDELAQVDAKAVREEHDEKFLGAVPKEILLRNLLDKLLAEKFLGPKVYRAADEAENGPETEFRAADEPPEDD